MSQYRIGETSDSVDKNQTRFLIQTNNILNKKITGCKRQRGQIIKQMQTKI